MTKPVNADPVLDALALIELIQRLGGNTAIINDYTSLMGNNQHQHQINLYLARMVVSIASSTSFPLSALIARERADALTPPEQPIGGMA